jgi:hypothetical protein
MSSELPLSDWVPASVRELPRRAGTRPPIEKRYPCPQLEDTSPPELREALLEAGGRLHDVTVAPTEMTVPGDALLLAEELCKGKPEGFVHGREFAIIRDDGSMQVNPDPEIGQLLLDRGWGTIHPVVRYMAGALPPQSMIVFAPRDEAEVRVGVTILEVVHAWAIGKVGDLILPDTAW